MKVKILAGFGGIVILVGAFMALFPRDDNLVVDVMPTSHQVHATINTMVNLAMEDRSVSVTMIIPGARVEKAWAFTGSLQEGLTTKPFYGQLRERCKDYNAVSCWHLESLVVDGQTVVVLDNELRGVEQTSGSGEALEGETPVAQVSGDNNSTMSSPANTEEGTQKKEPGPEVTTAQNGPTPSVIKEPQKQTELVPQLWRTTSDNVNVRNGPGASYDAVFKMPSRVQLTLVREENGWGLYAYQGESGREGRVWIAKSLVIPFE